MVARLHAGDAGPDLQHDAGAFMPEDGREQPLGIGARERELVGVADAGGLDLHQDLARLRSLELDVLDDERLACFVRDAARVFMAAS